MGGIRLIFKTQGFVEKPYRVREMDQSSAEELREKLEYILKGIYKREESVTTALVSKKYPLEKMRSKIKWNSDMGKECLKLLVTDQNVLFRYWDPTYITQEKRDSEYKPIKNTEKLRDECIEHALINSIDYFKAEIQTIKAVGRKEIGKKNEALLRALVQEQVENRNSVEQWLYKNEHFGVTEENQKNWEKLYGTIPNSERQMTRWIQKWKKEINGASWALMDEKEKVGLLDFRKCCQDLQEIAIRKNIQYPREVYGLFLRRVVVEYINHYRFCRADFRDALPTNGAWRQKKRYDRLDRLEKVFLDWKEKGSVHPFPETMTWGILEKPETDSLGTEQKEREEKVVAVEVIIREFFRWLDGKQDQGSSEPGASAQGKGIYEERQKCLQGRIRWVLSDKEKSWIPFKLLLMVGVLERQIWSYSEKDRKITKRIPKSNMYFNGPSQERQRILQLWMLQKLMDLFEVEQESRISQWESFLCIQGIEMANHEEVMFWRHILKRQYERLPCIGFQLYFLNNIWQAVPLQLHILNVDVSESEFWAKGNGESGYYCFYKKNIRQIRRGVKLLAEYKDFVNKYHEAWNKDRKEDGLSPKEILEKLMQKVEVPLQNADWDCTMWNQEKFNQANGKLQQGLKQMILETQCRMYIRRDTVKALGERFYDCYEISLMQVLRKKGTIRISFEEEGVNLENKTIGG